MVGFPAARLTDTHKCPKATGGVPHVGGPIVAPGCPTVLIGLLPAARVSDQAVCVGPTDQIVMGAFTTLIGGLPAARMGDATAHGGIIDKGWPTVLIGMDPASPAALLGAASAAATSKTLNDRQDAEYEEKKRREEEDARRAAKGLPPLTE